MSMFPCESASITLLKYSRTSLFWLIRKSSWFPFIWPSLSAKLVILEPRYFELFFMSLWDFEIAGFNRITVLYQNFLNLQGPPEWPGKYSCLLEPGTDQPDRETLVQHDLDFSHFHSCSHCAHTCLPERDPQSPSSVLLCWCRLHFYLVWGHHGTHSPTGTLLKSTSLLFFCVVTVQALQCL